MWARFRESTGTRFVKAGEEGLAYLSSVDPENASIVRKLVDNGAVFEATEDAMLVAESKSWLEMIQAEPVGHNALGIVSGDCSRKR